jgi:hypothetical protein
MALKTLRYVITGADIRPPQNPATRPEDAVAVVIGAATRYNASGTAKDLGKGRPDYEFPITGEMLENGFSLDLSRFDSDRVVTISRTSDRPGRPELARFGSAASAAAFLSANGINVVGVTVDSEDDSEDRWQSDGIVVPGDEDENTDQ